MHLDGIKILNLMFKPGELINISPNKYPFHAIPLENAFSESVTMLPQSEDAKPVETHKSDSFTLVSLNPSNGWRLDNNCTAFRNFLIEMDIGPLDEQIAYIEKLAMPYSASIFSGGKSIHFLISLDQDIPTQKAWRKLNQWVLNIVTLSDQNCKNPSRSIRVPGSEREPGKFQKLVEFKGKVELKELRRWLEQYPHLEPKQAEKRSISGEYDFSKVKPWVIKTLIDGLNPQKGRNAQWFAIACEFALAGYNFDDTIVWLEQFFAEESDFKKKEWENTVKSGFKHIYSRK